MELGQYYKIIRDKISEGDFTISSEREINPHLDAIIYIQYEFLKDRNDPRIDRIFSDVCIPNGVNRGEVDIDFNRYTIEEFLRDIMTLKD